MVEDQWISQHPSHHKYGLFDYLCILTFFNSLRPLVRISLCSLLVFVVFNSIGVAIALVVVFRAHLGDDLSDVTKQFFVKLQALQQSWTVVIVVRNYVGTKA